MADGVELGGDAALVDSIFGDGMDQDVAGTGAETSKTDRTFVDKPGETEGSRAGRPVEEKSTGDEQGVETVQRRSYANVTQSQVEGRIGGAETVINLLPTLGRVPRPHTVVLHTQKWRDITDKEVLQVITKCVPVEGVKCLQRVPGPRFRLTFRNSQAKDHFLCGELIIRNERVAVQEVDNRTLTVKLLGVPNEISNATVSEAISRFGKVVNVTREMHSECPLIEDGIRMVVLSDVNQNIPQKIRIGPYPVEIRYRGQLPQCNRCGEIGHRVATCVNEVKCFRCGENGHVQRQCFRCFLCGQFGHIRARCPQNRERHVHDERLAAAAAKSSETTGEKPSSHVTLSTSQNPGGSSSAASVVPLHTATQSITVDSNRFAALEDKVNHDDPGLDDGTKTQLSWADEMDLVNTTKSSDTDSDDDEDTDSQDDEDDVSDKRERLGVVEPSQDKEIQETDNMDLSIDPQKRPREVPPEEDGTATNLDGFQVDIQPNKKKKSQNPKCLD